MRNAMSNESAGLNPGRGLRGCTPSASCGRNADACKRRSARSAPAGRTGGPGAFREQTGWVRERIQTIINKSNRWSLEHPSHFWNSDHDRRSQYHHRRDLRRSTATPETIPRRPPGLQYVGAGRNCRPFPASALQVALLAAINIADDLRHAQSRDEVIEAAAEKAGRILDKTIHLDDR